MELLHFEMSCDQINLDFCMEKEENSRNAKDTHTHTHRAEDKRLSICYVKRLCVFKLPTKRLLMWQNIAPY